VKKLYHTWLYFYLCGSKGVEWQDIGLPQPNYLLHSNKGIYIAWKIKGFFGTAKSREYLNDIIARFVITFKEYMPKRLNYSPNFKQENAHINLKNVYDLKEFQNLNSLYWAKNKAQKAAQKSGEIDKIFWAIKLYIEARIRQQGEGIPVAYTELESWAFTTFWVDERRAKDKSTLKAKCRSVWNWYSERNWTITRKEWEMTRSERAKANAKLKAIRAENKVKTAIESLKFLGEKITVRSVAKQAGVAKATAEKYLRKFREEELFI
jgi:hypothetical protein